LILFLTAILPFSLLRILEKAFIKTTKKVFPVFIYGKKNHHTPATGPHHNRAILGNAYSSGNYSYFGFNCARNCSCPVAINTMNTIRGEKNEDFISEVLQRYFRHINKILSECYDRVTNQTGLS
jgi:hypothetical protein